MIDLAPPPLVLARPAIIRPAEAALLRHGGDPVALAMMAGMPVVAGRRRAPLSPRLYDVLTFLGLLPGVYVCLDARDASSYTTGQTWSDRSGNGIDFYRGTTSGTQGTDPTFTGSAGDIGAYWSFDGGDYFTVAAGNTTRINNLHKNNAIFSMVMWFYRTTSGAVVALAGTAFGSSANVGVQLFVAASGNLQLGLRKGGSSEFFTGSGAPLASATGWNFVGFSQDEAVGAGGLNFYVNGQQYGSVNGAYTSPSASNATHAMNIAAAGNGDTPFPNGNRLAMFGLWEGSALSASEMLNIYRWTAPAFA